MGKFILLFAILLCSITINAQETGSLLLKCKVKQSFQPIEGLKVEVFQDTLCREGITQTDGKVLFKDLKSGLAKIIFLFENHVEEQEVFIQVNQLFQYTVLLDSSNLKLQQLSASHFRSEEHTSELQSRP